MRKLKNDELGRKSAEEFRVAEKLPIVVVLDNVRSAYNVGSVFRTADAFPIDSLYLCGITGYPPHKEINKTALGSTETVSWKYIKSTLDAISELKDAGYKIYAIEQAEGSIMLDKFLVQYSDADIPKIALVFGHEVDGVQQPVMDICDGCIEIPQAGTKHSLNIATSAGVVMWEFFRQAQ